MKQLYLWTVACTWLCDQHASRHVLRCYCIALLQKLTVAASCSY